MTEPGSNTVRPKQVVYLWGAGATQAEISYLGAQSVNLLMQDGDLGAGVASRIMKELPDKWQASFLTDQGTDIEKLISLLAASNVAEYHDLATLIRRLYFEDIRTSLSNAKVLEEPKLAIALLAMHNNDSFKKQEVLTGIITTNHDGLLQLAAQRVHAAVDIGIPFHSADLTPSGPATTPLLHLHGSFTWTFGLPLKVSLLHKASPYSLDTVWIPPTILKESKTYPFNKLAGLAYELLSKQCDVLRVVGSSLTQNDWNVLSMIFNAQRHRELTEGTAFRVELIMPHDRGTEIARACSYLRNLTPIGFLSDGEFADYKEEGALTLDMKNPLAYWLTQKIDFHKKRGDFGATPLEPAFAHVAGEAP